MADDQNEPNVPDEPSKADEPAFDQAHAQRPVNQRRAAQERLEAALAERKRLERRRNIVVVSSIAAAVVVVAAAITVPLYLNHRSDEREKKFNAAHASCDFVEDTSNAFDTIPKTAAEAQITDDPATKVNEAKQYDTYFSWIHEQAKKARTGPLPDDRPVNSGTLTGTLATNEGDIGFTLDRSGAPCNVASIASLINAKYFDGTDCHRLTISEGLKVLQCGDPTGTGMSGPGYTVPDEYPTDLAPAPAATPGAPQTSAIYPRGTIAIANSGQPNSGGSQFFMVTGDTTLPPNYSIIGKVDDAGLAVLDKIVKNGIVPGESPQNAPIEGTPLEDGKPKDPVTIETATVS